MKGKNVILTALATRAGPVSIEGQWPSVEVVPMPKKKRAGLSSFGHCSRETLEGDIILTVDAMHRRDSRRDARKSRMRLRKLRGWH